MPMDLPGLIGDFGSTGILIFFVMFLIKKTLPQIVKSFQDDLKTQREFFASDSGTQRTFYADQMETEREFRKTFCEKHNTPATKLAQKEG
ncbi:MAG: hypothetical protein GY765_04660 [bacterium]|nr:hypothetical protein [bacterium]